jgi:hypothetical protein
MVDLSRIRKALAALQEAEKELKAALVDDERPAPSPPPPRGARVKKPRKTMRRGL